MGKFNATTDQIWQEIPNGLNSAEFGMPAYFNGTVYYGAVGDVLRAFKVVNAQLTPATSPTSSTTAIKRAAATSSARATSSSPRHRQRQGICGHHQRRAGVRPAPLTHKMLRSAFS